MKKQILVAIACLVVAFAFAQKKGLKAAEKAIKSNNYAEAKAALGQAEGMLSSMDDKLSSKYHLLKAQALYAGGSGNQDDVDKAIEELKGVGSSDAADAADLKNLMVKNFLEKANAQYGNKQYAQAAGNFENIFRVSPQDTAFLYNAAISADLGQEVDKALDYYHELKDIGYTGIETEFYAVEKASGEEKPFSNKNERDLYIKSGDYIKPSEKKTDSKRPEIVKRIALLYVSQGKNDEAISAVKEARSQKPKDIDLIITEANLYYQLEDLDRYKALIQEATTLDPNNADLYYNLGVVSADAKDIENAEKYYKKALELNPSYVNAKMNLAALILSEESDIIEEMNGLGNSAADNKRYDELKEKRLNVYRKAIPYLEGVLEQDPENDAAIKTLMNMYSAIGNDAKAKEMKSKLDAIGG
ncbi:MAG: tetratricopeptide repeat protein [Mangrovimonas sp.]|nr:tetratricopeptide repeat protein [Mangrovimonas sp.]